MKSFKEFLKMHDVLEFNQLIEGTFHLKENTLSEEQGKLLMKEFVNNDVYSKLQLINEDCIFNGGKEAINLNSIDGEIYLLLNNIGVKDSDYDNKKMVTAMEGLDFNRMIFLLQAAKKTIDDENGK